MSKKDLVHVANGAFTKIYEQRTAVPSWGSDGAMTNSMRANNEGDSATLFAESRTSGIWAPDMRAEIGVRLPLSELRQYIAELTAIADDLEQQQEQRKADNRALMRLCNNGNG
ncbi:MULTISPECIES: hypothetical protein [Streptosporangium]|uniref:Uncharacterized protein n=1 Tax=Streptosporangium brasiliense TaxID=47480 RepID=A0ABT9RM61_9ACTN|nr:hypothetical protein [Streptosporangium brasiliense]MDP9870388.1 hypothetical protein [Streptosporangium brasiliense]